MATTMRLLRRSNDDDTTTIWLLQYDDDGAMTIRRWYDNELIVASAAMMIRQWYDDQLIVASAMTTIRRWLDCWNMMMIAATTIWLLRWSDDVLTQITVFNGNNIQWWMLDHWAVAVFFRLEWGSVCAINTERLNGWIDLQFLCCKFCTMHSGLKEQSRAMQCFEGIQQIITYITILYDPLQAKIYAAIVSGWSRRQPKDQVGPLSHQRMITMEETIHNPKYMDDHVPISINTMP